MKGCTDKRRTIVYALSLMAALGLATPLHAQRPTAIFNFTCNIGGAPARLTTEVQAVTSAGVWIDPNSGKFSGAISTGDVTYYYGGSLISATARYSFTGTNAYADFVDLINNERFRVQMILQRPQLLMIINPQGPGPVQYLCQENDGAGSQRGGADLDRMMTIEREDLGVPATRQLHNGEMHGPTPNSIPGGQVVTTKGLVELLQKHPVPFVLIDALGSGEILPEAVPAAWASDAGSFSDQTQQRLVQWLEQQTKGNKDEVLVFYCLSRECWMSYNAALRAINAGYTNVLWYRGGIEAWKQSGLPTAQSSRRDFNPSQQRLPFGR